MQKQMKLYSPGASVKSDYAYTCDKCETDDGRQVLLWDPLPRRKGHFALCLECLTELYFQYNREVGKSQHAKRR